jgi:hypothetical protein
MLVYEYGEFLLCIGPVFLIIALIGLGLLVNSRSARTPDGSGDQIRRSKSADELKKKRYR